MKKKEEDNLESIRKDRIIQHLSKLLMFVCQGENFRDIQIMEMYFSGDTFPAIAKKIGLTESRIHQIVNHQNRHIKYRAKYIGDLLKFFIESGLNEEISAVVLIEELINLRKNKNELILQQEAFKLKVAEFDKKYPVAKVTEAFLGKEIIIHTKLEDINLSPRVFHILKASGIKTVGEVLALGRSDFLKFKNFGSKSLREIEDLFITYKFDLQ